MPTNKQPDWKRILQRMAEPSWLILHALSPSDARPGIVLIRAVNEFYAAEGDSGRKLDPSTLHYALDRMEKDGLVEKRGPVEVEVPGPHGSTRREPRSVFVITGLGMQAITRKQALEIAARRAAVRLGSYRTVQA